MKEVAQFENSFNAHLARTRLENAGIRAWVLDENTAEYTLGGRILGGQGIKLCVAPEDGEQAMEVLYGPRSEQVFTCPECEATEVDAAKQPRGFAVLLAALRLRWRRNKCRNCGYRWRGN